MFNAYFKYFTTIRNHFSETNWFSNICHSPKDLHEVLRVVFHGILKTFLRFVSWTFIMKNKQWSLALILILLSLFKRFIIQKCSLALIVLLWCSFKRFIIQKCSFISKTGCIKNLIRYDRKHQEVVERRLYICIYVHVCVYLTHTYVCNPNLMKITYPSGIFIRAIHLKHS